MITPFNIQTVTTNDHLVIPDGQIKPGLSLTHWECLGKYIVEHRPQVIVNIGDFWDMPSLGAYESSSSKGVSRYSIQKDFDAGNKAMDIIMEHIGKVAGYSPRLEFCIGNHEERIERAIKADCTLEGVIGYQKLNLDGWTVRDFLKPVTIDGVTYAHYFYNPMSGRPISGTIDNMLKQIGYSFTQGHRQEFLHGRRDLNNGNSIYGLVAGAFYTHNEEYKGHQANHHWRGIVHKHDVKAGQYDIETVSLSRLLRKYK